MRNRRPGPLRARPVALVAAVTVLAVVLAVVLGLLGGLPGVGRPAVRAGPAAPGPIAVPAILPPAVAGAAPAPTGLRVALAAALRDPALGRGSAAVVVEAGSGRVLLSTGAGSPVLPASTAKILTAVAALERLGPRTELQTRVVAGGSPDSLVLVGGGDPTLAGPAAPPDYPRPARLADLATGAARELVAAGVRRVRLGVDASLFSGPLLGPGWSAGYLSAGDVARVSALEVDGGRLRPGARPRSPDPAIAAGRLFAGLLSRAGVTVVGTVSAARVPVGAVPLAVVRSPPVAALVERMLTDSDNDLAEALARLVAVRSGLPGSFAGAATAVSRAVAALGVDSSALRLYDGSGLSRTDRLQPRLLTSLLSLAASPGHPELRSVLTGLPVAGLTGTLVDRYAEVPTAAGAGVVRAKTGTLTGVSTLAGVTLDVDGSLLAFALVAPVAPSRRGAEGALDRLAAALAGCGCR